MLHNVIVLFLAVLMLSLPVSATSVDDGGSSDGIVIDATVASSTDSVDPEDPGENTPNVLAVAETETGSDLLALDSDLAGGYYFTCDCALGNGLRFYVPLEFAHDVFTFDSSGALINLSNSTCYAYCSDFPDYTISCSRFSSFTYRASNYNTTDLNIRNVTDSNMTFLEGDGLPLSDLDVKLLIFAMIFVVAAILIIRGR